MRVCHFVTAIVSTDVEGEVRRVAADFGLAFDALSDSPVRARLGQGEGYYLTTAGHCDCGTPLGSVGRERRRAQRLEAKVSRLRRKGWSEAKLDRWREQTGAARDQRAAHGAGLPSCETWADFISAALDVGARSFGLVLHGYRGNVATEDIELGRRVRVAHSYVEHLAAMDEDAVYDFVTNA